MQQKPSIDLDSEAAVILFRKKSASVAMKNVQGVTDMHTMVKFQSESHKTFWSNIRLRISAGILQTAGYTSK